jgi:uncharacterized membrane protein YfcA
MGTATQGVAMSPEILLVGALSGFVQGLSGFAFGLVATSFWAWMMAPQEVVPLVVMGSLLGQFVSIASVRHHIKVRRVSPFVAGSLFGVPLGAAVLHDLDASTFRAFVGLGLIAFCALMLRTKVFPKIQAGRPMDAAVGFTSGALAGACGIGGPPMTLWCSMRNWDTVTQRATFQSFFIIMQLQVLSIYIWQGLVDLTLISTFAAMAPVIMGSSWLGSRVGRRYSDHQFQRIIFLLLLASGVALLAPSASRFVSTF